MSTLHIKDFTNVETIYKKNIRTVRLKIHRDYIASPDLELQTASTPYDVYEVLKAICNCLPHSSKFTPNWSAMSIANNLY
jgi:hypothetical protein